LLHGFFAGLPIKLRGTEVIPLTTYAGFELSPSFSPDGNQVVFSWKSGWKRIEVNSLDKALNFPPLPSDLSQQDQTDMLDQVLDQNEVTGRKSRCSMPL
jgi:Tol biopolymer transport system component